jgi:hypothetical protein
MVSNPQSNLRNQMFRRKKNNIIAASVDISSCLLTLRKFMTKVLCRFRIKLSSWCSFEKFYQQELIIKSKRFVFSGGVTFIRDTL